MDHVNELQKRSVIDSEKSGLTEEYRVGGVTLIALTSPHEDPPSSQFIFGKDGIHSLQDEIDNLVLNADGVIFEYFPEEIKRISVLANRIPLYENVAPERLAYFTPFADAANKFGKDAYVLDPAYDLWWSTVGLGVSAAAPSVITSTAVDHLAGKIDDALSKEGKNEISRRRLLKLVRDMAAGSIIGGGLFSHGKEVVTQKATTNPLSEPAVRRAIVSQGLVQMGENQKYKDKRYLIIYPQVHWDGIKKLIENEGLRNQNMLMSRTMLKGPFADKFRSIRHYVPQANNNWQLKEKVPIV